MNARIKWLYYKIQMGGELMQKVANEKMFNKIKCMHEKKKGLNSVYVYKKGVTMEIKKRMP